jgi:flagellar assembly protein FliH
MLGQMVEARKSLLMDLKPFVVDLTGEALRRCLKDEAEKHGSMVVEFVQEALRKAQDRVHLKLHLNPGDLEEVEAQKQRIGLSVGVQGIELVPDTRVELGGCRLETEAGSVDAQISTVVDQVRKTLNSDPRW